MFVVAEVPEQMTTRSEQKPMVSWHVICDNVCVSMCRKEAHGRDNRTYSQKFSKRLPEPESDHRPVSMQIVNLIKLRVVWLQFLRILYPIFLVHMLIDRGGCMGVVSEPSLFVWVGVLVRGVLLSHGSEPSDCFGDRAASPAEFLSVCLANPLRH